MAWRVALAAGDQRRGAIVDCARWPARPWQIWRFSDGKAGHDNQSLGLIAALAALRPIHPVTLPPLPWSAALRALWSRRWPESAALPAPDLLIGAGHGTHLSLLAARRACGGRTIVLMRPTLPLAWFDLGLVPEHDALPSRPNVFITRGALNRIQPSSTLEPDRGLFLIGGPSSHFGWDSAALRGQIAAIVAADSTMHWTLTTSRRTPGNFLADWREVAGSRLTLVPVTQTDPDWLPAQLARSGQVWVSADSVSMIYEALTAGAAVGVLGVPRQRPNRISRGVDHLAAEGWVTPFADWRRELTLRRPPGIFNEAERCARWIVEQWLV